MKGRLCYEISSESFREPVHDEFVSLWIRHLREYLKYSGRGDLNPYPEDYVICKDKGRRIAVAPAPLLALIRGVIEGPEDLDWHEASAQILNAVQAFSRVQRDPERDMITAEEFPSGSQRTQFIKVVKLMEKWPLRPVNATGRLVAGDKEAFAPPSLLALLRRMIRLANQNREWYWDSVMVEVDRIATAPVYLDEEHLILHVGPRKLNDAASVVWPSFWDRSRSTNCSDILPPAGVVKTWGVGSNGLMSTSGDRAMSSMEAMEMFHQVALGVIPAPPNNQFPFRISSLVGAPYELGDQERTLRVRVGGNMSDEDLARLEQTVKVEFVREKDGESTEMDGIEFGRFVAANTAFQWRKGTLALMGQPVADNLVRDVPFYEVRADGVTPYAVCFQGEWRVGVFTSVEGEEIYNFETEEDLIPIKADELGEIYLLPMREQPALVV